MNPRDDKSMHMYELRGVAEQGDEEALHELQKAADQGDADAQFNLGHIYSWGCAGVVRDSKEAFKWFQKAADQGEASAQFNLGMMYQRRGEVVEDSREAVKWHQKAADQGHPLAQHTLGAMYYKGETVERNYVTAYAWVSVASSNGFGNEDLELIEKKMTPDQIAEAQKLSRELLQMEANRAGNCASGIPPWESPFIDPDTGLPIG